RGLRLVTDAAYERLAAMRGEDLGCIGTIEPGPRHHYRGQPALGAHLIHPGDLAERIGRIPLGLDEDAADNLELLGVAQVVGRQIVALERAVVAVAEPDRRLVAQPRQVVLF